jgi:nitrogen fixation protein FixH
MKIDWGKGIVIAIVCFVGFILFFVIKMTTNQGYDHDLVTENYYEKELTYQQRIDASKNAQNLSEKITVENTADGLKIHFPKELKGKTMEGKVFLYRPSDKHMDFEMSISKIQDYLLVPDKRLSDGPWNISVEFKHENKHYLFTEKIVY